MTGIKESKWSAWNLINREAEWRNTCLEIDARPLPAAVQPMMYHHLEDSMKAKCESKDPLWTALLATWLQTAACLSQLDGLSSVPVQQCDRWLIWKCGSIGKWQEFYWGVPSYTSSNWDWVTPFLELYRHKMAARQGEAMLIGIFKADDFEPFSQGAVNRITHAAMQEVIVNSDETYFWHGYLPTMALAAGIPHAQQAVLADLPVRDRAGPTGPRVRQADRITEGNAGLTRVVKTNLAHIQARLRQKGIRSFEGVTPHDWNTMKMDVSIEESLLITNVVWENHNLP